MSNFKQKEIKAACRALSSSLRYGEKLQMSLAKMAKSQRKHEDDWLEMRDQAEAGMPLSGCLSKYWPDRYITAIASGEAAQQLPDVLKEISVIINAEDELQKVSKKVITPVAFIFAGIGVFIYFLLSVIPSFPSSPGAPKSFLLKMSAGLIAFIHGYWWILAGAGLGLFALCWTLFHSKSFRISVMQTLDRFPGAGQGLRYMHFSLWCRYLAILARAGIPWAECVRRTKGTLPYAYQLEADDFEEGCRENIQLSLDPDVLSSGDRRTLWPSPFVMSVLNGEQSGEFDTHLAEIVDEMFDEGMEVYQGFVEVMTLFGRGIAAAFIMSPMLAYFAQMAGTVKALSG